MKQGSNWYEHEGVKYDRVTRITAGLTPADPLIGWAINFTIAAAGEVSQHDNPDKRMWQNEVKSVAYRKRSEKATLGSNVHAAIVDHMDGLQTSGLYTNYIKQAENCLQDCGLDEGTQEIMLVNKDLHYAGTCDWWSDDAVLDWKTGKLYSQHLIQLWAYMEATHWFNEQTGKLEQIEKKPDVGYAAHIDEEGYQVKTIERGTAIYDMAGETFKHLQAAKLWVETTKEMFT